MQFVPLVFFSLLFGFLFYKRRVDASTYISFLYVLTSFFSVKMFDIGLVMPAYRNPSLTATIVYCLLLTAPILAIYRVDFSKLNYRCNKKCINNLSIFYFAIFVLFILLYWKDMLYVLTFGDMAALRSEAVRGGVTGLTSFSGPMNYVSMFVLIMSSASFIMILLFFISLIYLKNKWYFNLIIILGSLTSVLEGILDVSRSGIFYYVIFLGLAFSLFWKKMSLKVKARITPILLIFLLGMGVYFMTVSEDRFKNSSSYEGTSGGLIGYAGMSYSNFCYFFDYYNNPTGISTRFLLPATNYLINDYRGGTQREAEMEAATNFDTNIFMTYLGSFIMDCNQFAPFVFICLYLYLMYVVSRRKHKCPLSESWMIFIFVLLSIPAIGCITYYYTTPFRHLALLTIFVYCNRLNKSIKRNNVNYATSL